jgi:uncharacterized protein (TIGR03083 family)
MTGNDTDRGDADGSLRVDFASQLAVLAGSVDRLATLVKELTPEQLRQQAYPSEWTVADVLSHLGSGATITRERLDAEADPEVQAIWDAWNAKDPDEKAADALEADSALMARLASLTPDERDRLRFAVGPMDLDLSTFVGLRINEHALHTWDVAVTFDDSATLPSDAVGLVLDSLAMMAPFMGKPTGADRIFTVHTVDPSRDFEITLRPDGVAVAPGDAVAEPDLELTADALVRLVYGRLDPGHTPAVRAGAADLDELRRAFPGF